MMMVLASHDMVHKMQLIIVLHHSDADIEQNHQAETKLIYVNISEILPSQSEMGRNANAWQKLKAFGSKWLELWRHREM